MTTTLPVPASETAIALHESIPIESIRAQIVAIQELMKSVMKEGEHYGTIPGCGPKPTLLQPGAQKLCFSFRLAPTEQRKEVRDHPGGHREYDFTVRLIHRPTGEMVADGVGCCSTLESKYRYRNEVVGPVPQGYWDTRDQNLIGVGNSVKKKGDKWVVVRQVEGSDPADFYNTVEKMAWKRAMVHACVNGLAASDIFTQDIEDMKSQLASEDDEPTPKAAPPPPPAAPAPAPEPSAAPQQPPPPAAAPPDEEEMRARGLWVKSLEDAWEQTGWSAQKIRAQVKRVSKGKMSHKKVVASEYPSVHIKFLYDHIVADLSAKMDTGELDEKGQGAAESDDGYLGSEAQQRTEERQKERAPTSFEEMQEYL